MRPRCQLIGKDGNIFNLMAIASNALKEAHMEDKADEMVKRIKKSNSYMEALGIISEYIDIY